MHKIASTRTRPRPLWRVPCPHGVRASLRASPPFAYSPQGQISATQLNLNALTLGVHHQRNAQGQVTRVLYPSARALDITWSQARPSALSFGGQPLIQDLKLDPLGQPQSWNWVMGSGGSAQAPASLVPHQYTRDTQGRLIRQSLGPWLRDLSYDAAGRITGYTHWFNAGTDSTGAAQGYAQPQYDQQFTYDPVGRLTQVHTAQASWTYQYDANGNRTLVQLTPAGSGSATSSSTTTTTLSSTYTTASDSNRLLSTSNPAINLGYDAAGNMQSDGRYLLIHDAAGRLVQVQTTTSAPVLTHTLDNFNLRVKKQAANGSITHFVYDLSPSAGGLPSSYPHLLGEYDGTGNPIREYIWLGDTPIAVAVPDTSNGTTNNPTKLFHIHADHLNTPKVVIEASNGQRRWQWVEDEPFGSIEPQEVVEGARFTLPLRMAGQYADSETGMVYNHHRHYVAGVGRYTQSDPIGLAGGINTYAYVGGDPVNGFDPRGLDNPGMGPYDPSDPPPGPSVCIGTLDTFKHMWLCSEGSCSGYYGKVVAASYPAAVAVPMTLAGWGITGVEGQWVKDEYSPEQCEIVKTPGQCNRKKYERCITEKRRPRDGGYYHAAFSNCFQNGFDVMAQCLLECME